MGTGSTLRTKQNGTSRMQPCYLALASLQCLTWISNLQAAKEAGVATEYRLEKRVEAVGRVRGLTKLDMKLNDALPKIEVDPETYTVTADGEVLTCQPAPTLPLSRNYFLF
jgi:urease alpha subunit